MPGPKPKVVRLAQAAGMSPTDYLLRELNESGSVVAAAERMAVHEVTVRRWMEEFGINTRYCVDHQQPA